MKKILLLLFFCPSLVLASSLECDTSSKKVNDEFSCRVIGTANYNYESLTGKVKINEPFECNEIVLSEGMNEAKPFNNLEFNLYGISSTDTLFTLKCKVVKNVDDSVNEQIIINNFKYNGITEILRSNVFTLVPVKSNISAEKPIDTSNNDLLISSIEDENLDFTFSRFIANYNIEVLNEVTKIDPKITLVNPSSTYVISKYDLDLGDNVIDIVVSDVSGNKNTYTLNIKRLDKGEKKYAKESDAEVNNIEIIGRDFSFDKNKKEYDLDIKTGISSLDIKVTPNYEKASVNIKGNSNLKNNSKIIIEVKSENQEVTNKYTINIKKKIDLKEDANYIIFGIIGFLVVVLIIVILITNNRRYNKKQKGTDLNKIEVIDK